MKFLAHAGIYIEENGYSVMIDPWFSDSSLSHPFVTSIGGGRTIDFQLPKIKDKLSNFSPDAVLVSHFHPHHSPSDDIIALAKNKKMTTLAYPASSKLSLEFSSQLSANQNISLKPVSHRDLFRVGPFFIKCLSHTVPNHLSWIVESLTGNIVHIADSRMHPKADLLEFDAVWEEYCGLDFDIMFVSAAKSSLIRKGENSRDIIENAGFSPTQGAKLVQKLKPKMACLIGLYNHSIWKNWTEYRQEAHESEKEFLWALDWLAPEVKFVSLRPGHTFCIGQNTPSKTQANTYL